MRRENRPGPAPSSNDPSAQEPALLRPAGRDAPPAPHSERNTAGYQETPIKPSTAEADREASDNCALLHRARKESDDGCAPAEHSPGHPANAHGAGRVREAR